MSDNLVITIGRENGSGGREIGKMLSEELGIGYYDEELLDRAAEDSGLARELFETNDEKPTSSFLYSMVVDSFNYSIGYSSKSGYSNMPIDQRVFMAEFDAIKSIADEESCVIIGRCGDYALADYPNMISVFITCDEAVKITRLMRRHNVTESQAKDMMVKTDKKRASYYNYYSGKRWGDSKSYDLCINSCRLGIEGTVEIIKDFAMKKCSPKTETNPN